MPYTTPTANEFKSRFPRFLAVQNSLVDTFISEAERMVDTGWLEDDYQPAIMYLAAHNLTMEGLPDDARPVDTPGGVTSEKLGDASVTYGDAMSKGNQEDYGQTQFGRRFQKLLKRNVPGVVTL